MVRGVSLEVRKWMKESKSKPNMSVRIDPEVWYKAKIYAAIAKKTRGQWICEAIEEKVARESSRLANMEEFRKTILKTAMQQKPMYNKENDSEE